MGIVTRGGARSRHLAVHDQPEKPRTARKSGEGSAREIEAREAKLQGLLSDGLGVVVLKRGKARLFRDGNPMVYAGAVERVVGAEGIGAVVAVCDGAGTCLGYGVFNTESMFRVRILKHCARVVGGFELGACVTERVAAAVAVRKAIGLAMDDEQGTSAFRLVNGEGDRLSGLVVDWYRGFLVVSSSAMWIEIFRSEIESALLSVAPQGAKVIWRLSIDRLRQDGYVDEKKEKASSGDESEVVAEAEPANAGEVTVVTENGVQYGLPMQALVRGQKTGHYADQRDTRLYLRNLVARRTGRTTVLDLFCYTGGFSLNLALGSEDASVIGVDSSGPAIDMAKKNAQLNGVDDRLEFVKEDVMQYLKSLPSESEFDLVILDPPKLAPNAKAMPRAQHKYRSFNGAAISMVRSGGLLLTCTCSAAMTKDRAVFIQTVKSAARDAGREITLLAMFGAAADHPVAPEMPEAAYLTACLFACK